MTRTAQVIFAALVAATGTAFFATQRLRQSPRLVRTLTVTRAISPHVAYKKASIRIRLERSDRATVSIVDPGDDVVRRLARNRAYRSDQKVALLWNARDATGRIVPDGEYRVRVDLRRQGRSVVLRDTITVDGTPPRPVVRVQRERGAEGPVIFPPRRGGPVRFTVAGTRLRTERLFLYRTDSGRPRFVGRLPLRRAPDAAGTWNGRIGGRPAPPGPYVVVAKDTDDVGNAGFSYPFTPARRADPPGGPGVTVRYLAAQGPLVATPVGRRFTVYVDSRGRPWRWRLHRVGQTRTIARGTRRGPELRLLAPRGPSGLYVLELASGRHRTAALVPVQGLGRHRVLLVLPVISWQARNRVDDDGDGMIDTLSRNGRARLDRPLAGGGIPPGFAAGEEPLLRFLDRPQQRYDIATDVMLAGRGGARLLGDHRGLVLAGLPQWLPPAVGARLRRFVDGGGRVFSPGVDSLRRTVVLQGSRLARPSRRRSPTDIFGATLAPIERRRVDVVAKDDTIGLFRGGDGLFNGFVGFEATLAPGPRTSVLAAGVVEGSPTADPVIVALRVGDEGMVVRTGLPDWGRRLRGNPNVQALTRRAWTLLSR